MFDNIKVCSVSPPFAEIKYLLEGHAAPKRPNRVSPIHSEDSALQSELDAWEAASDEVFWNFNL